MHIKESNQKHRSNKRKGFTLIEVLVALACSVIAITTITGSLVFVNKINTQLIEKSSTLYKVKEIKHYILDNFKEGDDCYKDNNDIVYISDGDKKTIYSNITNISNVTITPKDTDYFEYILDEDGNNTDQIYYTYTTCTINYNQNGDKEYKFIVAANDIANEKYIGSSSEVENKEN